MNLFLVLALRNMFRNRIRTVVALLAIASGCAAMILNAGVVSNIFRELREDAIRGRLGHLQVYRRGYTERHLEEPGRYMIPPEEADEILRIACSNPRVLKATRGREFSGLILSGERRVPFLGLGVDPENDAEFSSHTTLRTGSPLSAQNPYGVVVGLGLARKLGGRPYDVFSMMTTTVSGALNAVTVELQGVFEGGLKEFDDWTVKMPLESAQHLLQDSRTEQIVLLLERTEDVRRVRAELEGEFKREGLDLEVRSWDELALFYNQVVNLFGRETDIIKLIVATIVILGIGNAIGMSIMERTVELATLRALGLRPGAIAALLMTEALITGLAGAVAGALLGAGIAGIVSAIGILYPSPPGSTRPFMGGVDVTLEVIAVALTISILATLAAAAAPVWKSVRRPVGPPLRQS